MDRLASGRMFVAVMERQLHRCCEAVDDFPVQQLVAERGVEALAVAALQGAAGLDEGSNKAKRRPLSVKLC